MHYEWPTTVISSWEQFVNTASRLVREKFSAAYLCRGQSCADWDLTPSLVRLLPKDIVPTKAIEVEKRLLQDFRSQAHLHVRHSWLPPSFPPVNALEWWALMQHYGAPTRLLDWTQSLYVAAYFAVENNWEVDGAIFLVHWPAAQLSYQEQYGTDGKIKADVFMDPDAPRALLFWSPERKSARFVAQQSFLSISTNLMCSHDELIVPACAAAAQANPNSVYYLRFTIPSKLKADFLRNLRAMNIAAHSLFPSLDGVCRSAAEDARLAFTGEQPKTPLQPTPPTSP